jgi:hypothetical protein
VDSWGLWCRVMAEVVVVVRRIGCVTVMAVDDMGCCRMAEVVEGYNCVVEVAEVGWCWVNAAFGLAMTLASTLAGKGYRRYTITLQASPALC